MSGETGAGTVTAFDDAAGLGTVTAADGTAFAFHCVEIDDGSRRIDVGTPVTFEVRRKLGGLEAGAIAPTRP